MHEWTPLGAHPDIRNLTPNWIRLVFLVIIFGVLTIRVSTGFTRYDGLTFMTFSSFLLVDLKYNWENKTNLGRSFDLILTIFFLASGLYAFSKP